jgi:hypothetical protein
MASFCELFVADDDDDDDDDDDAAAAAIVVARRFFVATHCVRVLRQRQRRACLAVLALLSRLYAALPVRKHVELLVLLEPLADALLLQSGGGGVGDELMSALLAFCTRFIIVPSSSSSSSSSLCFTRVVALRLMQLLHAVARGGDGGVVSSALGAARGELRRLCAALDGYTALESMATSSADNGKEKKTSSEKKQQLSSSSSSRVSLVGHAFSALRAAAALSRGSVAAALRPCMQRFTAQLERLVAAVAAVAAGGGERPGTSAAVLLAVRCGLASLAFGGGGNRNRLGKALADYD